MEHTVGQRLKWLLDSNNISARDFQRYVSVGEKQISNWISGTSNIQVKHIIEIASYFKNLSMDWFLLGREEPYIDGETNTIPKDNSNCKDCDRLRIRLDVLREECDRKDRAIAELNQRLGVLIRHSKKEKISHPGLDL